MTTPEVSAWEYDELGRKTRSTVGGRVNLGYRYDAVGRLEAVTKGAPVASAVVLQGYGYDELGRVTAATRYNVDTTAALSQPERPVTTTRTYDDTQRRFTETTRVGLQPARTVQADWVLAGNRWKRGVQLPDGRVTTSHFDGDGRLAQVERATGQATDFQWVDELLEATTTAKAGAPVTRTTEFDGLGQPTTWETRATASGPAALKVDVTRDVMGRVAASTTTFNGTATSWRGYVFDAMGRLSVVRELGAGASGVGAHLTTEAAGRAVEAVGDVVHAARWQYQREAAVGSLLALSRTDAVEAPRFTAAPRAGGYHLTSYDIGGGARAVTHDDAGRLSDDGTQGFVFDDMGALSRITQSGTDTTKEAFLYDFQGRLVGRFDAGGVGEVFVYDGLQMVQAYSSVTQGLKWTAASLRRVPLSLE